MQKHFTDASHKLAGKRRMTGHTRDPLMAVMYPSQEGRPGWQDFRMMPLAEFICQYADELEDYFDEDFGGTVV